MTSPLIIFLTLALALVAALAIDFSIGDPDEGSVAERWYPPVLVGRAAIGIERRIVRGNARHERAWGLVGWFLLVGGSTALAWALVQIVALGLPWTLPVPPAFLVAAVLAFGLGVIWLKSTFALRSLERFTRRPLGLPVEAMRREVAKVVNRPVSDLPEALLYSAVIESAVENTTDSLVAPFLAYSLFGLPGAVGYRSINTLDALWGHPEPRWRNVGLVAASVDRVVNYLPDRLAALLLRAGARRSYTKPTLQHGNREVPVPATIRTISGLLRVRLERRGSYVLGADWRAPNAVDVEVTLSTIRRATAFAALISLGLLGLLADVGWTYFLR